MSTLSLAPAPIRAGIWRATVTQVGDGTPQIEVTHLEKPIENIRLTEEKAAGRWHLEVPIPAEAISEGVQTFLIHDRGNGECIGQFAIVAGEVLGDDLRAEVDLLRAELDMLKRAFRRHCVETG
ncbi:MAG: hypothetical protein AAFV87_00825 [Pseudomonadota bacterium]